MRGGSLASVLSLAVALAGCAGPGALNLAAREGDVSKIDALIASGADVNAHYAHSGVCDTPLFQAAFSGQNEAIRDLLKHGAGLGPESVAYKVANALACAEAGHQATTVKLLLASGAKTDPNIMEFARDPAFGVSGTIREMLERADADQAARAAESGASAAAALTGGSAPAAAPERTAWLRGPDLPQTEFYSAVASVGGRFYVLGGRDARASQVYDPAAGEWTFLAPPPINRSVAAAAAVGRVIYIFGGCINSDCNSLTGETWAYDTGTNTWSRKAPMPTPRQAVSADVIRGRIYVAGGFEAHYKPSDVVTVYDPISDVWTTNAPMPLARGYGGGAAVGGMLYFAGGSDNTYGQPIAPRTDVMAYDPIADRWSMRAPLPVPLATQGSAAFNGKIYMVDGVNSSAAPMSATWIYDPASDSWSEGPATNEPRALVMTAASGGFLFTAGSITPNVASESLEYSAPPGFAPRQPHGRSHAPIAVRRNDEPAADVDSPSRRSAERPDDFALVIGIEKYSRIPEARFAENDADAVKRHLLALGYPERNIILLKGGQATRGAVQGYVEEWLPKNVTSRSRVVVYFSGHGSPDPKNGDAYLVPWDGDAMFLKSTAYPLKTLYAALGRLGAKHVIVALDSCFSGAGGRSVLVAGARPLVSRIEETDAPSSVTVLSAASGDEITGTLEDRHHGAFTYFLLKSFNDGKRTARSAYDELKPRVQDEAHRQNREQTPLMLGDDAPF